MERSGPFKGFNKDAFFACLAISDEDAREVLAPAYFY